MDSVYNMTKTVALPEGRFSAPLVCQVASAMKHLEQPYAAIPGESGPLKMVSFMVMFWMFFAVGVGVWSFLSLPTYPWTWIGDIIGLSRIPGGLEAPLKRLKESYSYWREHFRLAALFKPRFIGNGMIPAFMNFPHREFFNKYDEEGNLVKAGSWLPTNIWMVGLWAWHMFCSLGAIAYIHTVCSGQDLMGQTPEWWSYHLAYYWASEFAIVLPICFIHYHIEENDWFRYYKVMITEPSQELRQEIWNTYLNKMYNIGYRVSHMIFMIYGGLLTDASLEPAFFTKAWVFALFRWVFMFYYRWFSTHVHHQSMHTQDPAKMPTDGRERGRLQYWLRWLRKGGLALFGDNKYFRWKHTVHHKWNRDLMALANEDASLEDNLTAVIILNFIPPVLTCYLFGALSIDQFILVNAVNNYIAFDCHTNYDLPFKPMRIIPGISDFTRFHSFHHSTRGGDDHGLGEGGSAFSISMIDKIFGTYSKYHEWETKRLKAEKMPEYSYCGGPVDHDYEVPTTDDRILLEQHSGYGGPKRSNSFLAGLDAGYYEQSARKNPAY